MSEERRFDLVGSIAGREYSEYGQFVTTEDYDAAQAELAALREELAQTTDVLAIANETLGQFADDSRVSQQRLTAAEQRNADYRELVSQASQVIEQFMPSVGCCFGIDIQLLNRTLMSIGFALQSTKSEASE